MVLSSGLFVRSEDGSEHKPLLDSPLLAADLGYEESKKRAFDAKPSPRAPPDGRATERRAWVVVAVAFVCAAALLTLAALMSASDSDNEVSVGASFSDDFSAADWSRWSCPTGPSCQWTEGDEYCEAQSGLSWGARFANASAGEDGLELSLVYDDACGCSASGSSYTAGHLTSVDYFLHGNLSFVGRFFVDLYVMP